MKAWIIVLICSIGACGRCHALDAYHVGNSFTWAINPSAIADWAASRGEVHQYGYHIANGQNPNTMWENPTWVDFSVEPYGSYANALPNYGWDVLTLQPYGPWFPATSDALMFGNFLNLTLYNPDNRSAQVYIYESWPFATQLGSTTYREFWDQSWDGNGWSWKVQTRDYFQQLVEQLNATELGLDKDVLLVPVGDVLYALDERMQAGDVPGFSSVLDLYEDTQHLTLGAGYFIAGTTFYATMYRDNPLGLSIPLSAQSAVTPEFAAIVQRVVWDVVAGHPYSGVAAEIAGDFNGDRIVDLADYALWTSTHGSKLDLRADANLDFVVDTADYTIWRNHFNLLSSESAATVSVPEPGGGLMLIAALFLGIYVRGRTLGFLSSPL